MPVAGWHPAARALPWIYPPFDRPITATAGRPMEGAPDRRRLCGAIAVAAPAPVPAISETALVGATGWPKSQWRAHPAPKRHQHPARRPSPRCPPLRPGRASCQSGCGTVHSPWAPCQQRRRGTRVSEQRVVRRAVACVTRLLSDRDGAARHSEHITRDGDTVPGAKGRPAMRPAGAAVPCTRRPIGGGGGHAHKQSGRWARRLPARPSRCVGADLFRGRARAAVRSDSGDGKAGAPSRGCGRRRPWHGGSGEEQVARRGEG